MSYQDPKSTMKVVPMILPTDYVDTAPTSTDLVEVDTKGFEWLLVTVITGNLAGGTSWAIRAQDSATSGSGHANIESTLTAATQVTLTASEDGTVEAFALKCSAISRYVQLAFTKTGTFTASELAAVGVLTNCIDSEYLGATVGGIYTGA